MKNLGKLALAASLFAAAATPAFAAVWTKQNWNNGWVYTTTLASPTTSTPALTTASNPSAPTIYSLVGYAANSNYLGNASLTIVGSRDLNCTASTAVSPTVSAAAAVTTAGIYSNDLGPLTCVHATATFPTGATNTITIKLYELKNQRPQ